MSNNPNKKEYEKRWHEENRDKMRGYSKVHYNKHREQLVQKHAEHYQKNKEDYAKRAKRNHLRRNYSISLEDYEALLEKCQNTCRICSVRFTKTNHPCVDHSHETKKIRGILCRKCNLSLWVVENKEFLTKAIEYLNETMK